MTAGCGSPDQPAGIDRGLVSAFFDARAAGWDAGKRTGDSAAGSVLDSAGVGRGSRVLDIACGTGVLFPAYRKRGAARVTGVDLSPAMAAAAAEKCAGIPGFSVLCADAESLPFRSEFDVCIVYNALPHFSAPEKLIRSAFLALVPGGVLAVGHGIGRASVDRHHLGLPAGVAVPLPSAEQLAGLFRENGFTVTAAIDSEDRYLVAGRKDS